MLLVPQVTVAVRWHGTGQEVTVDTADQKVASPNNRVLKTYWMNLYQVKERERGRERGREEEGEREALFNVIYIYIYFFFVSIVGTICAVLSMDNKEVERTKWAPPSNTAWEQQFRFELDRVSIHNIYVLAFQILTDDPVKL